MRCFILTLTLVALAHGLPQQRQPQIQRGGRQSSTNYGAPDAAASAPAVYGGPAPGGEELIERADDEAQASYNNNIEAQASELDQRQAGGAASAGGRQGEGDAEGAGGDPIAMLKDSIPGTPGEDYPIYAEAPETKFSCDGQVNGGYYADPEAECQAFHICTADAEGGLSKYSFLCPNGTIFNQEYFICDWWFNVDCSKAEALATSRNAELEAARGEADARIAADSDSAASDISEINTNYGSPSSRSGAQAQAKTPLGSYGVADIKVAEESEVDPALSNYANQ